eukprot:489390-Hanusia_phi.AAC.1
MPMRPVGRECSRDKSRSERRELNEEEGGEEIGRDGRGREGTGRESQTAKLRAGTWATSMAGQLLTTMSPLAIGCH